MILYHQTEEHTREKTEHSVTTNKSNSKNNCRWKLFHSWFSNARGWILFLRNNLNDWEIARFSYPLQSVSTIILDQHNDNSILWRYRSGEISFVNAKCHWLLPTLTVDLGRRFGTTKHPWRFLMFRGLCLRKHGSLDQTFKEAECNYVAGVTSMKRNLMILVIFSYFTISLIRYFICLTY